MIQILAWLAVQIRILAWLVVQIRILAWLAVQIRILAWLVVRNTAFYKLRAAAASPLTPIHSHESDVWYCIIVAIFKLYYVSISVAKSPLMFGCVLNCGSTDCYCYYVLNIFPNVRLQMINSIQSETEGEWGGRRLATTCSVTQLAYELRCLYTINSMRRKWQLFCL